MTKRPSQKSRSRRPTKSNKSNRARSASRPRRPKGGSQSPRRFRRTRVTIPAAILLGCVSPCDIPPDAGGREHSIDGYCSSLDMMSAPDLTGACSMWACKKDEDCPATLCPTAVVDGLCRSGTCIWE